MRGFIGVIWILVVLIAFTALTLDVSAEYHIENFNASSAKTVTFIKGQFFNGQLPVLREKVSVFCNHTFEDNSTSIYRIPCTSLANYVKTNFRGEFNTKTFNRYSHCKCEINDLVKACLFYNTTHEFCSSWIKVYNASDIIKPATNVKDPTNNNYGNDPDYYFNNKSDVNTSAGRIITVNRGVMTLIEGTLYDQGQPYGSKQIYIFCKHELNSSFEVHKYRKRTLRNGYFRKNIINIGKPICIAGDEVWACSLDLTKCTSTEKVKAYRSHNEALFFGTPIIGVPEYSTPALGLAILITAIGLKFLYKKDQSNQKTEKEERR